MFRRPALGLGEIAWRWSFGFAAALLATFAFVEYLQTLPVSDKDLFLLKTRQPALVSQALGDILRGSGPRLVEVFVMLVIMMSLAWIGVASLGRAVTVKALLAYWRDQGLLRMLGEGSWRVRPLAALNGLRLAVTLVAGVGVLGAWILGVAASPQDDPAPGVAVLVFLAVATLVWTAWSMMNWLLSLAGMFVVAEGMSAFDAIEAAVGLCRERAGSVAAVGTWFGLAHLGCFVIATSVVFVPFMFAAILPVGVVLSGVLLITLAYFAAADFLYTGRLAAYVAIADGPEPAMEVAPLPPVNILPVAVAALPIDEAVDRDEVILSDVENPAVDEIPGPS